MIVVDDNPAASSLSNTGSAVRTVPGEQASQIRIGRISRVSIHSDRLGEESADHRLFRPALPSLKPSSPSCQLNRKHQRFNQSRRGAGRCPGISALVPDRDLYKL